MKTVMKYSDKEGMEIPASVIVDYHDDRLALDTNVMLADMACAMVFMGCRLEENEKQKNLLLNNRFFK